MPFVRRKRGQVLLVHNERIEGSSRVRQRELHRFASPAELRAVLPHGEWAKWTRSVEWREDAIEFHWPPIRERLQVELDAWDAAPSGATHRRDGKIERLAAELVVELAPLSLAQAADAVLVDRVRPLLLSLRDSLSRLISPARRGPDGPAPKESDMPSLVPLRPASADHLFDEGMEHWWAGDRRRALTVFRRVLAIDPHHADAHNHLGIASLDAKKPKIAERHFRAAIDGGARHVTRDGARVAWNVLENRPYLRGLGNLALALAAQRQWAEAHGIHRQMLQLNPNDNQGVRWLIGVELLHLGDDRGAIDAFKRCAEEEVGCAFGLALARLRAFGPSADIGEPLLAGFAENRYVAPMLLGERCPRLAAYHGTSMAEPEWAKEVVQAQAELWHAVPRGAELLRFWWSALPVVAWRRKLDDVMLRLETLLPSPERSAVVSEWSELRSEMTVRELVRTVRSSS